MVLRYKLAIGGSVIVLAAAALGFWFFYGQGLSERTAYALALDEAQKYAQRHGLDLSQYSSPVVGDGSGKRLYTFTWAPKPSGGPRLTVVVDSQLVTVKLDESP